jgi:Zn-dependent protease
MTFTIVFLGWLFSLCLHEFAHAFIAYHGGDYTVREKGYLTFNPLRYTHPLLSIILPLLFLLMGGIGLPGGAVYIETWRIRNRYWLSGMALAGPMANVLVALVLGILLRFTSIADTVLGPGLSFLLVLQVWAILFNLIPVPPLDGYNILAPFLSPAIHMQMERVRAYGIWIIILAIWYIPFVGNFMWTTVFIFSSILGADWNMAIRGLELFRFWNL